MDKYDGINGNNLPTPFYDEQKELTEYVYSDKDRYEVCNTLEEALANVAKTGLCYNYTSCTFRLAYIDEADDKPKKIYGHTHSHSFEEVLKNLYSFPESFSIDDRDKNDYSYQQLEYINRVKKYLLFIGLKDIEDKSNNIDRFKNTKHDKYKNCRIEKLSNKIIDEIITGKRDYLVSIPYNMEFYNNPSCIKGIESLIVDEDNNFKLLIKYTTCEIKDIKDNRDLYNTDNYVPDNKVVVEYFEVLEKF